MEVHGVEEVLAATAAMAAKTLADTGKAVRKVLHQVARQERTQLSLGWHPPGTRTGSVPPEPPWRISGHLSRSVRVQEPVLRGATWFGQMGPTAVYSRIHELSGITGAGYRTFLPKRPHLMPAWRIVEPSVLPTFINTWARSTRPPRL